MQHRKMGNMATGDCVHIVTATATEKIGTFSYGVFTLPDTDTDTNTDIKWVVEDCVEVFIPTPTSTQMQLGFKPIVSVSVPMSVKVKSVSVSGSVNTPLNLTWTDVFYVYVWFRLPHELWRVHHGGFRWQHNLHGLRGRLPSRQRRLYRSVFIWVFP